ncbi:hypothetical protein CQW23_01746 [Capsicum baccatum]|uniref:Ubiquitin-like protease family profile domain-containing protein n=1 Tax=Capsicum baccatum TaxID=33114 RepID=A0A2G2XPE9_CAPBA|nr:hypothetical protein CQW23_01746 [Capsicum baccatum]
MIEYQKNVDSQFHGMREFVEESVKLILNELRLVKQQSSEFVEKENEDVGLQTPNASKKQDKVLVDSVIEKYSFGDDVSIPLDVSNNSIVNNPVNDQSPLDDIPFFTESQLVVFEPIFRVIETPKAHIAMPIMCLYVYDSMMGGVVHSKNVLNHVQSLSTMILMYLVATNFYGKRSNIDWHQKAVYIDKSLSEPLEFVILKDTPQQEPQSNDCCMFVCAFAEYVSHGMFDISSRIFGVVNHQLIYGALLWDYARRKQNDGAISESEQLEMLQASMVVSKDLGSSLEVQGHDNTTHKTLQQ